jgi:hypothetical protein
MYESRRAALPAAPLLLKTLRSAPVLLSIILTSARNYWQRPPGDTYTWAGTVRHIVEIATESWENLVMVSILLLVLAIVGVAWVWLPRIW